MKKYIKSILYTGFLSALLLPSISHANIIVNTGPGTGAQYLLNHQQWLAAEFITNQSYNITEVSGWIGTVIEGDVTFSLYTDGGNLPGSILYSSTKSLTLSDPQWETISGLNWDIDAGSYWIAFTTIDEIYRGIMPGQAPNQLGNEAHTGVIPDLWFDSNDDNNGIGVMIQAEPIVSTVPEPTNLLILGSVLIALNSYKRKLL